MIIKPDAFDALPLSCHLIRKLDGDLRLKGKAVTSDDLELLVHLLDDDVANLMDSERGE